MVDEGEQEVVHANEDEEAVRVNKDVGHTISVSQPSKRKKYERILKNEAC